MTHRILLFIICFIVVVKYVSAQSPAFTHFTTDDGLPSTEVYCAMQDSKGYMWFGTNNGVCRFDGSKFTTYAIDEGMPDNVVFEINEDSQGRIWFICFSGHLAYFSNGKIAVYPFNDKWLKALAYSPNYVKRSFRIDNKNNVSLNMCGRGEFYLSATGNVQCVSYQDTSTEAFIYLDDNARVFTTIWRNIDDTLRLCIIKNKEKKYLNVSNDGKDGFGRIFSTILFNHKLIFSFNMELYMVDDQMNYKTTKLPTQIIWMGSDKNGNVWVSPIYGGVHCYINGDISRPPAYHFLKGYTVSSLIQDNEGGYWITTTEAGVYYFNNNGVLSYTSKEGITATPLTCISKSGDSLWVGGYNSTFYTIKDGVVDPHVVDNSKKEIRTIKKDPETGDMYVSLTGKLFLYKNTKNTKRKVEVTDNISTINDIWFSENNRIWYATIHGLFGLEKYKTIYGADFCAIKNDRFNSIIQIDSNYAWLGSNSGLYNFFIEDLKKPVYRSEFAGDTNNLFKIGINDLARTSDGSIWIASRGGGLIIKEKNSIVILDKKYGLFSNTIKCLEPDGPYSAWVGTSKGLHRVYKVQNKYLIESFTSNDGIAGDEIMDLLLDSNLLYVVTKNGVSLFSYKKVRRKSIPPLIYIESVKILGIDTVIQKEYKLESFQNQVSIELTGISYRSMGNIRYAYKLIQNDEPSKDWQIVEENIIRFPYLPGGDYSFIAYSINKDGLYSLQPIIVNFNIKIPFYKKWWFYGLISLISLLIVSGLFYWRMRITKEKNVLMQRASNYMLQSLNRQLNPHFIYNALNTIQFYILNNDKTKSNQYLSKFAGLMRQVLHNSQQNFISIADEIELLEAYITLEAMRFNDRINYKISIDPNLDTHLYKLPPLLFQPLIENAIIHGLIPKEGTGLLTVEMLLSGKEIICRIQDNGIGRIQAAQNKPKYKKRVSMGINITQSRINLINDLYKSDIKIQYEDLYNNDGTAAGTTVIIKFPLIEK